MVNDRIRSPRLAYDFECKTEYYIIQTYMYIRHPGSPDIINRNRYVFVYTRHCNISKTFYIRRVQMKNGSQNIQLRRKLIMHE